VSEFRVGVIIPAAGRSRRFGSGDKLAQDVGGRPMILRTVELFTRRDDVTAIVVAAPPEGLEEFRDRYGAQLGFHGAKVVAGGTLERWETVRNALQTVPEECTHIAVHDAARPAAPEEMIARVFEAARMHGAVIPGEAVTATLKRVSTEQVDAETEDAVADAILGDMAEATRIRGRRVVEGVSRENLVAVQTPQVFREDLLRRAYAQPDLAGVTDDAALVERLGEPVIVVEGDPRNIKVTTLADLALVRAVLGKSR
jgi:2-C-methyl-D-erythritol 4-phosphate cytidylyltransferase